MDQGGEDGYISAEDADYVPGEDEEVLAARKRKAAAAKRAKGRKAKLGTRSGGIALSDDEADGSSDSGADLEDEEEVERELTPGEKRQRAKVDSLWAELSGSVAAPAAAAAVAVAGATAPTKKAKTGKKKGSSKQKFLASGTWQMQSAAPASGPRLLGFKVPGLSSKGGKEGGKEGGKKKPKTKKTGMGAKGSALTKIVGLAKGEAPEERRRPVVDAETKARALAAARAAARSDEVTVTETVRFAGQTTTVERTLRSGEELRQHQATEAAAAAAAATPATGLDKVLSSMKAPKGISTVMKSSADWDRFKSDEGIAQELDQETRDGYLAKQGFLQRCDERLFEHEKEERTRRRAKR